MVRAFCSVCSRFTQLQISENSVEITFYLEKLLVHSFVWISLWASSFFSFFIWLQLLLFSFRCNIFFCILLLFLYNYRSFQFPICRRMRVFYACHTLCILYNEIIMWYFILVEFSCLKCAETTIYYGIA